MAKAALNTVENEDNIAGVGGLEEVTLSTPPTDNVSDLDAMFDQLESGLSETQAVVGDESEQIIAGQLVVNEELKAAAIAELDENSAPTPDEALTPAPVGAKKEAPQTKRIRTLGMAKSEALAHALGSDMDELLTLDKRDYDLSDEERFDKRMNTLQEIDGAPKKIGEKVTNLFAAVARGAILSNYTRIAIEHLNKDGELTSKSLRDLYLARPYSPGTASSQCTQMMKLLPLLGMATRSGDRLTMNEHSLILPMLVGKQAAEDEEAGE